MKNTWYFHFENEKLYFKDLFTSGDIWFVQFMYLKSNIILHFRATTTLPNANPGRCNDLYSYFHEQITNKSECLDTCYSMKNTVVPVVIITL